MGNSATTRIVIDGIAFDGEVLLETSELILRVDRRRVVRFDGIQSVEARDGVLRIVHEGGVADVHLGPQAERWAEKIRNPKTVVQKLGVKAGHRVAMRGHEDPRFLEDLKTAGAEVFDGGEGTSFDAIFYGAEAKAELAALEELRAALAPDGALWVIRPKGIREITENDVMTAGRAAGLVDTKVVGFSETHTAEKFVIPIAQRVR